MATCICARSFKRRGCFLSGGDADVDEGEPDVEVEDTRARYVDRNEGAMRIVANLVTERQLSDQTPTSGVTHSPATASGLHTRPSISRQGTQPSTEATEPVNAGN